MIVVEKIDIKKGGLNVQTLFAQEGSVTVAEMRVRRYDLLSLSFSEERSLNSTQHFLVIV